jgi:Bacterial Ig-like domain (group 3)
MAPSSVLMADTTSTAFIWNQATNETENLQDVLTASFGLGSALSGWKLTEATAVTPDGKTIVGIGNDPQGRLESWIVHLGRSTPTPTPTPTPPTPTPTPIPPPTPSPTPSPIGIPPPAPAPTPALPPSSPAAGPRRTKTVLTAQPKSSTFGRTITLTASVANLGRGGGSPIGDVTFFDGSTDLGAVALNHGKARLRTSDLPVGHNSIQVYYAGSENFEGSSSGPAIETIRPGHPQGKLLPSIVKARSTDTDSSSSVRRGHGSSQSHVREELPHL